MHLKLTTFQVHLSVFEKALGVEHGKEDSGESAPDTYSKTSRGGTTGNKTYQL